RHHDVQQHRVKGLLLRQSQSLGAIFRLHGDFTLAAEVVAEDLPELSLVLRNQNSISHGSPSFATRIPERCVPSVSVRQICLFFLYFIISCSRAVCHSQFLPLKGAKNRPRHRTAGGNILSFTSSPGHPRPGEP